MIKIKYQGSKNRHARQLLPIILKDRKEGQWVYDLFCGGCNLIDKVDGNRVANDYHYYLIEMWKALQEGWIPPILVTEDEYKHIQNNKEDYPPYLVGYVGFNSFGAKFFGGYRRDKTGQQGDVENMKLQFKRHYDNIIKQYPNLQNVIFTNKSYDEVELQPNSIIYLDPPYRNTTKYKTGDFNYDKFYQWCIDKHNEGHQVFISEYWLPEDKFKCVWQKEVNSSLTKDTGAKKNIEKLFIPR